MGMIDEVRSGTELYAKFDTSEGTIVVRLFTKDAPKTVENFVGLATGEKEWTHPATRASRRRARSLYDGTIFHRCISNFMVQGGDPLGPRHRRARLPVRRRVRRGPALRQAGAARRWPTRAPTPTARSSSSPWRRPTWLSGKHTIFGEVVSGQDVVDRVANIIPKGANDRPKTDVKIKKLTISKAM